MNDDAFAGCPDENSLVAFVGRRLPAAQQLAVQSHLDACAECLALVCDMARADYPATADAAGGAGSGAAAAPPANADSAGAATVGRYRLVRMVGAGGMGSVFEAYDPQLDRNVAVKVLRADRVGNPEARARLLREARTMAKLSHRNVVTVFDAGEAGPDRFFIAMELVVGKTLGAWLRERERSAVDIMKVMLEAGRGLAAAHAAGIIHRDFKPDNVLVDHEGRVAVADFGLAGIADEGAAKGAELATGADDPAAPALTKTGTAFGTPHYMSPEQHAGGALDERTDQFSFAVALYEALYGQRPFAGTTVAELREAVGQRRVAEAGEGAKAVPPFVRRALLKALSPNRDDRFPTMAAFMAAVERPGFVRKPWVAALLVVTAATALVVSAALARSSVAPVASVARPAPSASARAPSRAGGAPITVLVLGIENRTSDPDLSDTADEILSSALARSTLRLNRYWGGYLRTLARELESPTLDESLGQRVLARDGGTVVLVRGAIAPKGPGYALSITATYADGGVVTTATRDASEGARVVPAIGLLASDLRAALGDPPPADPAAAEQTSMSLSLEADHELALGGALVDSGKYAEALPHLQRAVELDPHFAKAYHTLAVQLGNLGRKGESIRAYELGIASMDALSDQGRLQLLAGYYRATGEYDKASGTLAELLRLRPGESNIETSLANAYHAAGDLRRALEIGRLAASEHPHNVIPRSNLAWFEVTTGDLAGAARDASAVLGEFPHPPPTAYVSLEVAETLLGHADRAAAALDKLVAIDPPLAASARADLAMFDGQMADAAAALESGLAADAAKPSAESAAVLYAMLAEARLERGDTKGALAAAEHAATADEVQTLYAAGAVFARAGRDERAASLASVIATRRGQDARVYAKLLSGEASRARGLYAEATRAFEEALTIRDAWLGHLGLAQTSLAAGDAAGAERELAICRDRRGEGAFAFSTNVPSLRLVARLSPRPATTSR
jgi:serine/threonine protein kinase/tetratricopeptide (TPR) repeat protein